MADIHKSLADPGGTAAGRNAHAVLNRQGRTAGRTLVQANIITAQGVGAGLSSTKFSVREADRNQG